MSTAPAGDSAESCSSEASATTPTEQTGVEDYGTDFVQSKWDWILPGLGEPSEDCGKNRIPEHNTMCPNGDSIRYEPLRCRKVECPDCYRSEQIERTFRIALEVEARAKVMGERPHALTFSVPPDEARTWTYDRLNTSLFRRGYRRMRDVGIDGGFAIFHPWRVQEARKKQLRRRGYGSGGDKGGYWKGVREDVLDLGDARRYAKFGPHGHNIGFPERIEAHESEDFVIKKYAELEGLEDVISHVRYLLTHRGVRDSEDVGRSVRSWGAFHHSSSKWRGAEEELSESEYNALARKVAHKLGKEWNAETGEMETESDHECPECGTAVDEFLSRYDIRAKSRDGLGRPWVDQLGFEARSFVREMLAEWKAIDHDEDKSHLVLDDLDPPDSVTVFSTEEDSIG